MPFFKKHPLSFSFLYWFILTGLLSYFSFIFCSNIFPRVYVQLKFYGPEKFIQLVLLPNSRYISSDLRYSLSGSSCYPARTEMQLVLYLNLSSNQQLLEKTFDYQKRFTITRDELQSLENCFHTFRPPTVSQQAIRVYNSRIPRIEHAKLSGYQFYLNTNMQRDFQIDISVPLKQNFSSFINVCLILCTLGWFGNFPETSLLFWYLMEFNDEPFSFFISRCLTKKVTKKLDKKGNKG